jgi:hypothetical protein
MYNAWYNGFEPIVNTCEHRIYGLDCLSVGMDAVCLFLDGKQSMMSPKDGRRSHGSGLNALVQPQLRVHDMFT